MSVGCSGLFTYVSGECASRRVICVPSAMPVVESVFCHQQGSVPSLFQMRESAKFQLLAELLPELRDGGHRVLLFSQWTSILNLVEWLMKVPIDGPERVMVNYSPADRWPYGDAGCAADTFTWCTAACALSTLAYNGYSKNTVHVQDLGMKYVRLDGSTAVAHRLTIVDMCVPHVSSSTERCHFHLLHGHNQHLQLTCVNQLVPTFADCVHVQVQSGQQHLCISAFDTCWRPGPQPCRRRHSPHSRLRLQPADRQAGTE
jgi:hypothetical protein